MNYAIRFTLAGSDAAICSRWIFSVLTAWLFPADLRGVVRDLGDFAARVDRLDTGRTPRKMAL